MTSDPRLGPPPVEPLSDTAWARVERGVWSRLDAETAPVRAMPPRRWWLAVAPLAAAAAVAAIILVARARPDDFETSRVVTEAAPSSVSFGDSHLELDAYTALVMSREAAHPLVLLERGAARFTVAPRAQRPAFIVRAGDVAIRVVGTQFRVARSVERISAAVERISVAVERGLVNVEYRGSVVAVGAGQRWSSDAPATTTAIAVAPAPGTGPAQAQEPEIEMSDGDADTAPPAAPAKVRGHKPKRSTGSADARADVRIEPKAADPAEVSDDDPDRTEYDRLAALEPRSPDVALKGYMALARGTSRWAAPALYAAARLAVDRHDARAETLLGIYLQRFPDGGNAADARKLLTRLKNP